MKRTKPMKKHALAFLTASLLCGSAFSQMAYEIKINFKNCKDSTFYLAKYFFGQTYIVDSAKQVKNGQARFSGKEKMDAGVYVVANQRRERYFDFLINEKQKFTLVADCDNLATSFASPDSKENDDLAQYGKYFTAKNLALQKLRESTKGMSKADSTKKVTEAQTAMGNELRKFDAEFMEKHKGSFVYDFLNMRTEKYATDVPLASNGRPDSVYQYNWYKAHYFDGVNFKDERILYTPFLADRINRYFEQVIVQHPDSVLKEVYKILDSTVVGSAVYNRLLAHFMYKFETNKNMIFDRYGRSHTFEEVFVRMADKYVLTGKSSGVYDEETVTKIKNRVNILRNLLPEAKVADLFMIDTTYAPKLMKMGFDTVKTSKSATDLYVKHASTIAPWYTTLYNTKAKYTVLVFWAADCGHCQTEIPLLNKELAKLKGKIDFKVFAVQTKNDLYDKWHKFIIDHKLDFINVIEGVHINNLTERFDINRTPVVYILDREKRIKAKNVSAEQVVEILNSMETQKINE